jgi:hypothetical protein
MSLLTGRLVNGGAAIDSLPKQEAPVSCEEADIENRFQEKVQEGCKIRHTYSILDYTRRDKLFLFVGVGVFTRFRGGSSTAAFG